MKCKVEGVYYGIEIKKGYKNPEQKYYSVVLFQRETKQMLRVPCSEEMALAMLSNGKIYVEEVSQLCLICDFDANRKFNQMTGSEAYVMPDDLD